MFFDTREPAPLSVRWARVITPLVMCFAYTVFRVYPAVHERIPLSELLSAGAMFAGLVLVAFLALGDLCVPRLGRYPAATVEEERTWPGWHDLGTALQGGFVTAEIESFDAEALRAYFADVPANGGVMSGVLPIEPDTAELFTHEYHPQHHTPPRGITLVRPDLLPPESYIPTVDAFGQRTGGGRHALKDGE